MSTSLQVGVEGIIAGRAHDEATKQGQRVTPLTGHALEKLGHAI